MAEILPFLSRRAKTMQIGRDLIAVIVLGVTIGIGAGWVVSKPSHAEFLIAKISGVMEPLLFSLTPYSGHCRDMTQQPCLDQDARPKTVEVVDIDMPRRALYKTNVIETGASETLDTARLIRSTRVYPLCTRKNRQNCVVDGDTFYHGGEKIRIADIDTPETHPSRCAIEERLGQKATRRLSELISGVPLEFVRTDRDVDIYGRKLRIVMRNGGSVGTSLVREGLAREWRGHRDPWCPS